jgi:polyisoprenoid-binding protein YceI
MAARQMFGGARTYRQAGSSAVLRQSAIGSKRALLGLSVVLILSKPASAEADAIYSIDQQVGSIEFSVNHLGIFTYRGAFRQFQGRLVLDLRTPSNSRVDIIADTASVYMSPPYALSLLRSPSYFDVDHFPRIRFVSSAISPGGVGSLHDQRYDRDS